MKLTKLELQALFTACARVSSVMEFLILCVKMQSRLLLRVEFQFLNPVEILSEEQATAEFQSYLISPVGLLAL